MGIQYESIKLLGISQEVGTLVWTVTHTSVGVCGIVSKYRWDKVKSLIWELVDMKDKVERGSYRANMESIRGFQVYVTITYQDMNPYPKGLHLDLDSWRPFRDEEV